MKIGHIHHDWTQIGFPPLTIVLNDNGIDSCFRILLQTIQKWGQNGNISEEMCYCNEIKYNYSFSKLESISQR